MLGIIAAMNVEMESLRSHIENPVCETIGGVAYVSGRLEGRDVVTAVCGVGKVFAALCAQAMILRYQPEYIINTGVAGTLTGQLSVGDVAISSGVVQHDMDTSPLGDPRACFRASTKSSCPPTRRFPGGLPSARSAWGSTPPRASSPRAISSWPARSARRSSSASSARSPARWRAPPSGRRAT